MYRYTTGAGAGVGNEPQQGEGTESAQLLTNGLSLEGVKACDLPDIFASSCWGMPNGAVTFHASCVDDDRPKVGLGVLGNTGGGLET